MKMKRSENFNMFWAELIIEELCRWGVEYFCLAPGARSAPLALTLAGQPRAKKIIHFDERGLGYYALGCAAASKTPVAVITTSGTAAANLLPAVVEASKKKLPLIILTADRPVERQKTGAHQTIQQQNIFGEHCRFFFDFPAPGQDVPAEFVLTTVDQAVYMSRQSRPGPVHLNCPYREPLVEKSSSAISPSYRNTVRTWRKSGRPFSVYERYIKQLPEKTFAAAAEKINRIKRGVILCGKLNSDTERDAVKKLAGRLKWPVFPDIVSGLRTGDQDITLIPYYDLMMLSPRSSLFQQGLLSCDGILHLGGRLTSKRCSEWVKGLKPDHYIMVLNHPLRHDPFHNVTLRLETSAEHFCRGVLPLIKERKSSSWWGLCNKYKDLVHKKLDAYLKESREITEPALARTLSGLLPSGSGLFLANSMPLRIMDMYADDSGAKVIVGANRGASGIDGTLASAAGFAEGLRKPVTLLIGDQAFLHDLNSLPLLAQSTQPVICVILNNFGGGIFSFLPLSQYKEHVEKYFAASHQWTFNHAAEMFGCDYAQPRTMAQFTDAYQNALKRNRSACIEMRYARAWNHTDHQALQNALRKVLT